MTSSLDHQCYREGFARGLIKSALASRMFGPMGKAEMEALGERLFQQNIAPGTSIPKRLVASLLPNYGQHRQVMSAITASPRGIKDPLVRKLLQELGESAHGRMQFYGQTLPIAAGVAGGVGGGLALGQRAGGYRQQRMDEETLRRMPLWDRLKYVVMPHALNLTNTPNPV